MNIELDYDHRSAPLAFAAKEIESANQSVAARDAAIELVTIHFIVTGSRKDGQPDVGPVEKQGYAIRRSSNGSSKIIWVIGGDEVGAMYGGLDVAEEIRIHGNLNFLKNCEKGPHLKRRGIKFNIPLDARSPSYSDDSTSGQANIGEVWSMEFWSSFLDEMARHRYNYLSLWSLIPFPSLVEVPEYPNASLDDVKRKKGDLWDANLKGINMYDPSWELETLKKISIQDKIKFWRSVMQYAHDRGIEISIFTWNIFTYGLENAGYGITSDARNPVTKDYFRKAVRTLFQTYPLLAGIGITAGENMGKLGAELEEEWLWSTYGEGVNDAMNNFRDPQSPDYNPDRKIELIHRSHWADLETIVNKFSNLIGYDDAESSLSFSFKYSQAHMLSSTKPLFIYQKNWFDSIPEGKKTWLTVRSDDMYYMRWGDPDFAREYILNFPDLRKIAGFYMGPDGYTWGRDFLSKEEVNGKSRLLVIQKHRYNFMIWGRLAYDPKIPNQRFQEVLESKFPAIQAADLYAAWSSASKIVPLMTRFYYGSLDYMWYPEACWRLEGFVTANDLINTKPPMSPSEDGELVLLMSIKEFVNGEPAGGRITPIEVSQKLKSHADLAMNLLEKIEPDNNEELQSILKDIEGAAWLGKYFAEKIEAATFLHRFNLSKSKPDRADALKHFKKASEMWRRYAQNMGSRYLPQVLTRMGLTIVDIEKCQAYVDKEIQDLLQDQPE